MENNAHISEGLHQYIDAMMRGGHAVQTLAPSAKTPEEAYALYQKAYPHQGFLEVQTFTARRAYPVKDARVVISKTFPEGQYVIARFVTDEQGMTPTLTLPAASKALSETPGNPHPYTTVDVTVSHPDYVTMHYLNVPMFEGVVSLQNADLIPLSAAPDGTTNMTIDEMEPDL